MDPYDWQSSLVKFTIYVVDTENSNRAAYIKQSKSQQDTPDRGNRGDKCLPPYNDSPVALRPSPLRHPVPA